MSILKKLQESRPADRGAQRSRLVSSSGAEQSSPAFMEAMTKRGAQDKIASLYEDYLASGGYPDRTEFVSVLASLAETARDRLAEAEIGTRTDDPITEDLLPAPVSKDDKDSGGVMPLEDLFGVSMDELLGGG